jgi:hypothetical protein
MSDMDRKLTGDKSTPFTCAARIVQRSVLISPSIGSCWQGTCEKKASQKQYTLISIFIPKHIYIRIRICMYEIQFTNLRTETPT